MKIVNYFLTENPCYKANKKIVPKGIMLHSVGCPQPKASVFVNSWNTSKHTSSCVHGFIDATNGTIYQTLPWNHRGWHGGGSCNNTHIGIEMCEPNCIIYLKGNSFACMDMKKAQEYVKTTYNSAVNLFAHICRLYDLDPDKKGVIVSHKEGYKLGIASNHGDPEHLWKGLGLPYTMDGFRKDVKNKLNKKSIDEIAREVIQGKWGNGKDRIERLTKAGYDYSTIQKRVNEIL